MSTLMLFHVVTGTLAVLSGALALFSVKGSRPHRSAGTVFVLTMLAMASAGTVIALQMPLLIAAMAGVFTCYLVLSGWATVNQHRSGVRWINRLQPVAAFAIAATGFYFGWQASLQTDGLYQGYQAPSYYFFAILALLGGLFDIEFALRTTLSAGRRLARHLWRMCMGLFLATGSLFTGPGAQAFPQSWQGSAWLSLPENTVLVIMLLYLIQQMLIRRLRPKPQTA